MLPVQSQHESVFSTYFQNLASSVSEHSMKYNLTRTTLIYKHILVVSLVSLVCVGAVLPPMPTPVVKKKPSALHSPRGKEMYLSTPMAVVFPPKHYMLSWSYPLPIPRPGVLFVIEARNDMKSPWMQIGITDKPPFPIATGAPSAMFRVGTQLPFP